MKANFELVKFISFRYSATVYQGELCVLLYHSVFYGSKIVNISETSTTQGYIQISKKHMCSVCLSDEHCHASTNS